MKPMKFSSMLDLPNWAPLISTTCSQGCDGLRASMIARWYGARSVRHSPRSAADSELSRRFSSAHCDTVMSGGGRTTGHQHLDLFNAHIGCLRGWPSGWRASRASDCREPGARR